MKLFEKGSLCVSTVKGLCDACCEEHNGRRFEGHAGTVHICHGCMMQFQQALAIRLDAIQKAKRNKSASPRGRARDSYSLDSDKWDSADEID